MRGNMLRIGKKPRNSCTKSPLLVLTTTNAKEEELASEGGLALHQQSDNHVCHDSLNVDSLFAEQEGNELFCPW